MDVLKKKIIIWGRDRESGKPLAYVGWIWEDKYGVHIIIPRSQANMNVNAIDVLKQFSDFIEVM